MVEAGTWSLLTKVHPEKKTQSKKTRRCLIGNLIHYQTPQSDSYTVPLVKLSKSILERHVLIEKKTLSKKEHEKTGF